MCAAITPLFEARFVHDSYANRKGKGTHAAIARYEQFRNRHRHVLRCDIFRYFPAIDHAVLKHDIGRVVRCSRTRDLIGHIIDGSNAQEPVIVHFPGDDLFTPHERRRDLPIGNLTSQLFANVDLDPIDHLLKDRLRVPGYVRNVDDLAVFHDDEHALREVLAALTVGSPRGGCWPSCARPGSPRPPRRRRSSGSSCSPMAAAGCLTRTSPASATACAGCATGGGQARSTSRP